jgi:hypothetical protein
MIPSINAPAILVPVHRDKSGRLRRLLQNGHVYLYDCLCERLVNAVLNQDKLFDSGIENLQP